MRFYLVPLFILVYSWLSNAQVISNNEQYTIDTSSVEDPLSAYRYINTDYLKNKYAKYLVRELSENEAIIKLPKDQKLNKGLPTLIDHRWKLSPYLNVNESHITLGSILKIRTSKGAESTLKDELLSQFKGIEILRASDNLLLIKGVES